MLRTALCALLLAFPALAGPASAEQTAQARIGMEIRGDDGVPLGRIAAIGRDAEGRIVSITASGLDAPADAPPYVMAPRRPGAPTVAAAGDRGRDASRLGLRAPQGRGR